VKNLTPREGKIGICVFMEKYYPSLGVEERVF